MPTCLAALLASDPPKVPIELVVVVNGSDDETYQLAEAARSSFEAADWRFQALDLVAGGKVGALNHGDKVAAFEARIYLDADVVLSPQLLAELVELLDQEQPVYCSGTAVITAERSLFSKAYARFYACMPFVSVGVPGFGLFGVNAAGRKRWDLFPEIISDDTFVRLHFTPRERHLAAARYEWPVVEGFRALVRVRRRQDQGVVEIQKTYPHLLANDDKRPRRVWAALRAGLRHPIGFVVYFMVAIAVRLGRHSTGEWSRGR